MSRIICSKVHNNGRALCQDISITAGWQGLPVCGSVTREILEIKKHMTSNVGTLICLPAADIVFRPHPSCNNHFAGGMVTTMGWEMNVCRPGQ